MQPTIDWWALLKERALPMLNAQSERGGARGGDNLRASTRRMVQELFGDAGALAFDVALDQAKETSLALLRLPTELDRALQKLDRGELTIQLDLTAALLRIDHLQQLLTRVWWTVLFGIATGLGFLLQAHRLMQERDGAFALAAVFLLVALFAGTRRRERSRVRRRR